MKRVHVEERWCVDCKRCEVACKVFHSKSKDIVTTFLWEKPEPQTRIHVEGDSSLSVAVNCRHCHAPSCVEGCISGALTKDSATGIVLLDSIKCVGCGTCLSLCPFGCVYVNHTEEGGSAYKCDLCVNESEPSGQPCCVEACPNKALIYVESEVC